MAISTSTIPQLPLASSIEGSQVFEISDGTTSYKVTFSQLVDWLNESGGVAGGAVNSHYGDGSPEGSEIGSPGETYVDRLNHAFYVKETGVGNTGWLQYI